MAWTGIFHLGDLAFTVPVAVAIAAWLLAEGGERAALRWLLVFGLALGTVGASKIAYLGWATGVPALDFKALSGHATGFAASFPMLCHLLARRRPPPTRRLVAGAATAATMGVATALVLARQHSAAEAAAGWLLGTGAFLAALPGLSARPVREGRLAFACAMLAFALCASLATTVPVGYWMIKAALVLSGKPRPTPWLQQTNFPTYRDRRQACTIPPSSAVPGSDRACSTTNQRTRT